ncbi:MAG: protease SohB [Bdellovibrionaceae bacterium]|jgi:serine protease SohB|nr:protease SohB [Pseudobdellovibrionaceae bacterium]
MEILSELGVFGLKALIIVISIVVVLIAFAFVIAKNKFKEDLEVKNINKKYKNLVEQLKEQILSKEDLKKAKKAAKKEKKKNKEDDHKISKKIFVLSFDGDIKASQVEHLRDEISAVLQIAQPERDEVVIKLESPGGMVHGYGLAAAQLLRIKQAKINLTVCVDKVAASGGYMMACTADKILSAPFAILGSIGVIAQVPNINRLLKKHDVDYQEMTAGEYKRTISLMGEITEKGRKKFIEDLEDTHELFKDFVVKYRPQLDINKIATGEHWFGLRALDLKLVDMISTSDDYILSQVGTAKVFSVSIPPKKKFQEKVSDALGKIVKEKFMEGIKENQIKSTIERF